jgi:hypothetical protein
MFHIDSINVQIDNEKIFYNLENNNSNEGNNSTEEIKEYRLNL